MRLRARTSARCASYVPRSRSTGLPRRWIPLPADRNLRPRGAKKRIAAGANYGRRTRTSAGARTFSLARGIPARGSHLRVCLYLRRRRRRKAPFSRRFRRADADAYRRPFFPAPAAAVVLFQRASAGGRRLDLRDGAGAGIARNRLIGSWRIWRTRAKLGAGLGWEVRASH